MWGGTRPLARADWCASAFFLFCELYCAGLFSGDGDLSAQAFHLFT